MNIYYTGIGSRKTPPEILTDMKIIAYALARSGFILRSGAADGADSAFEAGCDTARGDKQIFLPWDGFNGKKANGATIFSDPSQLAMQMAEKLHPAWGKLTDGGRKLHARNCHQICGPKLTERSEFSRFIVCWTPGTGGTEQALRLARQLTIPIINLEKTKGHATLLSVFKTIAGPIMNSRPAWMEVGDEDWDNCRLGDQDEIPKNISPSLVSGAE